MPFGLNSTAPLPPGLVGGNPSTGIGASVSGAFVPDDVNKNSAFEDASFMDYLQNMSTGNLDYNRTLELLNFEQAFNREEAEKNRHFQKLMSDTSFQRAALDLKKAGFNPALMVGLGGASTPTGSNAFSTSKQPIAAGTQMTSIVNNLLNSAFKLVSQIVPNPNQALQVFAKAGLLG